MITEICIERAENGFIVEAESKSPLGGAKKEKTFVAVNESQVIKHVKSLLGQLGKDDD